VAFTVDNVSLPKSAGAGALPSVYDVSSRETFSGKSAVRAIAEIVAEEIHNVADVRL